MKEYTFEYDTDLTGQVKVKAKTMKEADRKAMDLVKKQMKNIRVEPIGIKNITQPDAD